MTSRLSSRACDFGGRSCRLAVPVNLLMLVLVLGEGALGSIVVCVTDVSSASVIATFMDVIGTSGPYGSYEIMEKVSVGFTALSISCSADSTCTC